MKRYLPIIIVILFFLFHYSNLAINDNYIDPILLEQKEETFKASAKMPSIKLYGKYIGLMDADSRRILFGKDETKKAPMASTTKIMTGILALESGKTKETVKVSAKAASMPKVHLGIRSGETYILEDLLYSLMLTSHNDSAVAIAEHLGGSVEGFAKLMNQKAKKLGMKDTEFVTPNGLDANGHESTAKDMCLLGSYAIKNSAFCSLIKTGSHAFRATSSNRSFKVGNKDAFLSIYDGALGIKTGFTSKAGFCFVGAAKKNDVTLVSTTLASGWPPNKSYKWQDTKALMDFGFKNYKKKSLPTKNLSYLKIPVEDGLKQIVSVQNIDAPVMLLSNFDDVHVSYQLPDKLTAPVIMTVPIGHVIYYVNDSKIVSLPIYPSEDIAKKKFSDVFGNVLDKFL